MFIIAAHEAAFGGREPVSETEVLGTLVKCRCIKEEYSYKNGKVDLDLNSSLSRSNLAEYISSYLVQTDLRLAVKN